METKERVSERRITVYDMAGMRVREVVFSEGKNANFSGLPCGTYTLRFISTDGNVMNNQLVILRS